MTTTTAATTTTTTTNNNLIINEILTDLCVVVVGWRTKLINPVRLALSQENCENALKNFAYIFTIKQLLQNFETMLEILGGKCQRTGFSF